jgi:hypothetical protein
MLTHTTENSESFKSSTLNYKTISLPHNGYKSLHSLFDNQIKAKIFEYIYHFKNKLLCNFSVVC